MLPDAILALGFLTPFLSHRRPSTPPLCVVVLIMSAPAMTQELLAMVQKVKLPDALCKFLVEKDFVDVEDISLLGDSEKDAVANLQNALPTDGSIPMDITVVKNVKKLWGMCLAATPKAGGSGGTPTTVIASVDDDAPLPNGVPEAIEKAWVSKHGFHFSGARLLVGSDYNRVYNCLNKKQPIELPKMDPQKYRLQNEGVTGESKGLFLSEDGHVSSHKKFFCEIVAHDMLWWKIRAYLSTVCYLTVLKPDFFNLQSCENFIDALHDMILAPTASGGRLSLNQCKIAWMNMISAFHVRIFQSGCSLQSLTESEMFWKHHWAWHTAGASGSASSASAGSDGGNVQTLERRLQSALDRAESKLGNSGARQWRGGKQRGKAAKRANSGAGGGGAQKKQNTGGSSNFNTNIPPANKGNGGKSAGRNAFQNRQKNKGGGKK